MHPQVVFCPVTVHKLRETELDSTRKLRDFIVAWLGEVPHDRQQPTTELRKRLLTCEVASYAIGDF
jgi:hypothetical protein